MPGESWIQGKPRDVGVSSEVRGIDAPVDYCMSLNSIARNSEIKSEVKRQASIHCVAAYTSSFRGCFWNCRLSCVLGFYPHTSGDPHSPGEPKH